MLRAVERIDPLSLISLTPLAKSYFGIWVIWEDLHKLIKEAKKENQGTNQPTNFWSQMDDQTSYE